MSNNEIRQLPMVKIRENDFYVTIALSECGKQYEVFTCNIQTSVPEAARQYAACSYDWDANAIAIYEKATLKAFSTFNPDERNQRWLFKSASKAVQAAKRWHRKFQDIARAEARKAQHEAIVAARYERQRFAAAQKLAEAFDKLIDSNNQ